MNEDERTLTIDQLLAESVKEGADIGAVVTELQNGRVTTQPKTTEYQQQIEPKLHDVMDTKKRPDKLVVVDKNAEDYGEVKNVVQKRNIPIAAHTMPSASPSGLSRNFFCISHIQPNSSK